MTKILVKRVLTQNKSQSNDWKAFEEMFADLKVKANDMKLSQTNRINVEILDSFNASDHRFTDTELWLGVIKEKAQPLH